MSSHIRRTTQGGTAPYAATTSSSSPHTTRRLPHHSPRTSSPPASTYFSPPAGDDQMEMHPTPGAQEHFAYSTTLRRHSLPPALPHGEAFPSRESVRYAVDQGTAGLWDRLVGIVKGKNGGSPEENGYIPVAKTEQTPSATYSSYHADVCNFFAFTPSSFPNLPSKGRCHTIPDILDPWLDRRCHPLPPPSSWL